ncbi:hypothetical protein KKH27_07740 [bacterium]|nr:hypothetical protein [bacterium]
MSILLHVPPTAQNIRVAESVCDHCGTDLAILRLLACRGPACRALWRGRVWADHAGQPST